MLDVSQIKNSLHASKLILRSTLIMLHEAHSSLPHKTSTSEYFETVHHIKTCISDISNSVAAVPPHSDQMSVVTCAKEGSPFLVNLLYLAYCVEERRHKNNREKEPTVNLKLIKKVLGVFSTRWKSASMRS